MYVIATSEASCNNEVDIRRLEHTLELLTTLLPIHVQLTERGVY